MQKRSVCIYHFKRKDITLFHQGKEVLVKVEGIDIVNFAANSWKVTVAFQKLYK
jgi:hypothetical protein